MERSLWENTGLWCSRLACCWQRRRLSSRRQPSRSLACSRSIIPIWTFWMGARRRPSTSLNRGQELRDPISGWIGPMRHIVLSHIDLTIRQQALSLAIMVVGIRVNKAVPRDKGRASHTPDLCCWPISAGPYQVRCRRTGHGPVGRTTETGRTLRGRSWSAKDYFFSMSRPKGLHRCSPGASGVFCEASGRRAFPPW